MTWSNISSLHALPQTRRLVNNEWATSQWESLPLLHPCPCRHRACRTIGFCRHTCIEQPALEYKRAGDAIRIDLFKNPMPVERDPTNLFSWVPLYGYGTHRNAPPSRLRTTPHDSLVNNYEFGEIIHGRNGDEWDGSDPRAVIACVNAHQRFTSLSGVSRWVVDTRWRDVRFQDFLSAVNLIFREII